MLHLNIKMTDFKNGANACPQPTEGTLPNLSPATIENALSTLASEPEPVATTSEVDMTLEEPAEDAMSINYAENGPLDMTCPKNSSVKEDGSVNRSVDIADLLELRQQEIAMKEQTSFQVPTPTMGKWYTDVAFGNKLVIKISSGISNHGANLHYPQTFKTKKKVLCFDT